MKAISYRMTDDIGHAPCAFDNLKDLISIRENDHKRFGSKLLTLSCCGKNIRRMAEPNDYVLGIAGNIFGDRANKLIWAGQVESILTKEEYFKQYPGRPDNYYKKENGIYVMQENTFHDASNEKSDLNPANTLLFRDFWYFGGNTISIPENVIAKNYPKYIDIEEIQKLFLQLKERFPEQGVLGVPLDLEANREALMDWI